MAWLFWDAVLSCPPEKWPDWKKSLLLYTDSSYSSGVAVGRRLGEWKVRLGRTGKPELSPLEACLQRWVYYSRFVFFFWRKRTSTWAKEELIKLWKWQECTWSSEITWNQALELHRVTSPPLLSVSLHIGVILLWGLTSGKGIIAPRCCHISFLQIPTPERNWYCSFSSKNLKSQGTIYLVELESDT